MGIYVPSINLEYLSAEGLYRAEVKGLRGCVVKCANWREAIIKVIELKEVLAFRNIQGSRMRRISL